MNEPQNLRECSPECCGTCKTLHYFGPDGAECSLEGGPHFSMKDLVDAHYLICDSYEKGTVRELP